MTIWRFLGAKFTPNWKFVQIIVRRRVAQNCAKTLSTEILRKYFSRQWRDFLLSEIFHELFRVQMHIKVNILTRLSRVNNDPG